MLRVLIGLVVAIIIVIALGMQFLKPVTTTIVGEETGNDTQTATNGEERPVQVTRSSNGLQLTLVTPSSEVTLGDSIDMELQVKNTGSEPRELMFSSSKKYDFWVEDAQGREVWRWSKGRMFAQALETITVEPKMAISFNEKWTPAASGAEAIEPGEYALYAIVAATELKEEPLRLNITIKPEK